MVEGIGRTPNKAQGRTGKLVQTKSIECQVSPGLLNGDEDDQGQLMNEDS